MTACPSCQVAVGPTEQYCEACGAELSPAPTVAEGQPAEADAKAKAATTVERPVPADLTGTAPTCQACGGEVSGDGYCGTCGARATRLRDHFIEQPAAWVAAVCDRGIRHTRNEDAVALAADTEPGSRAVLVVCDGVSNTTDSDLASLAAARVARDVLGSSRSRGMSTPSSLVAAVTGRLEAAVDAASEAVLEVTRNANGVARAGNPAVPNPASCTFVAAVVEQDLLVVGSVGDSRAYWLPDVGKATVLTLDDSFAQLQIASGVPRAEAETGPQSHAITRWLGVDAPDHKPTTATMTLAEPGWLLVCSDGLWNYSSAAQDLAALVQQTSRSSPTASEPLALADALVDWANAQGGQDNITVALARIQPGSKDLPDLPGSPDSPDSPGSPDSPDSPD
jgi:serine/threonine protein phosphatase PrpC